MTSERLSSERVTEAFVWVWLPGEVDPVVCGKLVERDDSLLFTYGRSYLDRDNAMPLHPNLDPDIGLALNSTTQRPPVGLEAHGAIRDAAPDSWGMRVNARRLVGVGADTNEISLLAHLLAAGSNRIGALHVQRSAATFEPSDTSGTIDELAEASEIIATGQPLTAELDAALNHASSVGGARPKATLSDSAAGTEHVVKFSVSTDVFPWIEAEAVGMEVARQCGVNTARTDLGEAAGRTALIVERFDRPGRGVRRHMLSALSLTGLNEMVAHHGSYIDLVELIRKHFTQPDRTLEELFTRIAVNIAVGNTDDHLRNHAAFWDGAALELTPAYDVAPQPRDHGEAHQAMSYGVGMSAARFDSLRVAAIGMGISASTAADIIERCATVVSEELDDVCARVGVSDATRDLLDGRSVNNPSIHYRADARDH